MFGIRLRVVEVRDWGRGRYWGLDWGVTLVVREVVYPTQYTLFRACPKYRENIWTDQETLPSDLQNDCLSSKLSLCNQER